MYRNIFQTYILHNHDDDGHPGQLAAAARARWPRNSSSLPCQANLPRLSLLCFRFGGVGESDGSDDDCDDGCDANVALSWLFAAQALGLCTLCECDGEQRWEFPCFAKPEQRTENFAKTEQRTQKKAAQSSEDQVHGW